MSSTTDDVTLDDDAEALVLSINAAASVDEMLDAGEAEGAATADTEAAEGDSEA